MNIIRKPQKKLNYIVVIAIGETFLQEWKDYLMPSLLLYCENNDLGLIVFEQNIIQESDPKWKKATWQKWLIGKALLESGVEVRNACFLDADILVNPYSPNVFDQHDEDKISVVSKRNMPYDYNMVCRKIAFHRNRYMSNKYPLDSSLFISIEDLYKEHNLPVQIDEFCSGFFVFNVNNFAHVMSSWFDKYESDVKSITNDGDQTHTNYEFQNYGKIKWIDYKFQALWFYEMAEKYSFLYQDFNNQELINDCIRASLKQNYFLHFAGRWEGNVWKNKNIMSVDFLAELSDFNSYLKVPVTGKPLGVTIGPD